MNAVDRFGAQAVFGRVLGVVEMRRMAMARQICDFYYARDRYRDGDGKKNWVEWSDQNSEASEILMKAELESKAWQQKSI